MRGSSIGGAARAGRGCANFEAAYSAPNVDAPARKFRREKAPEKLFMGSLQKSSKRILVSCAAGKFRVYVAQAYAT
jgi:hypothetical protein